MKTLLLVDAHSLIHRAFHALPPLTSPDGRPAQALYGLGSIFLKLWREERPDYAAACFDRPEPTLRKKKYDDYKAQRPKAADELVSQLIEARNFFAALGVPVFEKPGYEADDVIATMAEKFRHTKDTRVVILTGDLDTLQLVKDGEVAVRTFKKGVSDTMIYDEAAVTARYGLRPDQLCDYKAFVGDPSDNIKGVAGIGPKTATEMLLKYGTLEEIYRHIGDDKKLAKLEGTEKDAQFSKELVVLERNVPLEMPQLVSLETKESGETLATYFRTFGFESLLRRMEKGETKKVKSEQAVSKTAHAQTSIFGGGENKTVGDVVFLLSDAGGEPSSSKTKVGFALKERMKHAWAEGKDIAPPYFDLGVAFWLLDSDLKEYEPESIAKIFLRRVWSGSTEDMREAYAYAQERLTSRGVAHVFTDIEMPMLRILAEMEHDGIGIDRGVLKKLEARMAHALATLEAKITELAGEKFNLNSPKQVGAFLERVAPIQQSSLLHRGYGGQAGQARRNGGKRTPTGQRSTRAENLESLRDAHPAIPLLLEYREAFKILSTYVRPFQELCGEDGRLRTTFLQTGTGTGRVSSQSPNLQNIPKGSVWADALRAALIPKKGYTLLAADYSQIELRILASLSGDQNMRDAFLRKEDIHRTTAAKVFGVSQENVTSHMRQLAKTLNFGLVYGMGATAFAHTSGITREEAKKFIATYFEEFRGVKTWQEKIVQDARARGYVETPTGRRRYLPDIASGSPRFVSAAERVAINHPVQGCAADLIKLSMIRAKAILEKEKLWRTGVTLMLSIHDELLFEVRDDMIQGVVLLVCRAMEEAYTLDVPLRVEVRTGAHYAALLPITRE